MISTPIPPERQHQLVPLRKIRYAVVGLGHIAQSAVLPGLEAAGRNSLLGGLVSDDHDKLVQLGARYGGVPGWSYERFDECLRSGLIDAVYIALPNDLHADFAIRAARAGVHVLCEKPMALNEVQCRAMIEAADANGVRLMIGYRLHFERANLAAIAAAGDGNLGDPRFFTSTFSMQVAPGDIRTRPIALGGGSLYDLGIYCINAARYLFRDEPLEVTASSARLPTDERFIDGDEMTAAILRFPGERLATFVASFGAASTASYELVGTRGSLRIENSYEYEEEMTQILTIGGNRKRRVFPRSDQFAAEIDQFSQCILDERDPEPSGEEGLSDIRVIEALQQSVRNGGRPVRVRRPPEDVERPGQGQEVSYPPNAWRGNLVHTKPSSLT